MRTLRFSFLIAVPVALASSLASTHAQADEKETCVAASDQAQALRDEGKFRATRAQLLICSRDACPSLVRHDCEKWLADLDAAQPSVVLGARDPKGNDATATRVLLDGALLVQRLDGKPIAVDPGEHTFRYEAPGAAPVEQHAVIRVGEKNRMLTAVVMPLASPAAAPSSAPAQESPTQTSSGRPIPGASIALAAVAGAAGVSFAYFGLSGRSDVSDLRSTCAPNCSQDQVDSARTKLLVADVSLGVGVVALAAAGWLFFRGGPSSAPQQSGAVQAGVEPRTGGAVASVTARF